MSEPVNGSIDIGARLRSLRKSRAVTLSEVAQQSGLSISYISKIERDQVKPSFDVLHRIVEVLGLTLGDVVNHSLPSPDDPSASEFDRQAAALQHAFSSLLESDRELLLDFVDFLKDRAQKRRLEEVNGSERLQDD
ncbi:helix-turn-helix domain-containing protein [Saccharospirillum salsuginis]|uniref:HTH cro/C1-type domain-containing protein n=1 Tax=Saccharospirillum salsuginis TaxID=418750 RepID=A0A918KJ72_9GAMM|nr:helix-turn-helix transcriptional regulator [Saccharospirillum salsuginis]GGX65881.1 hypothetical protein GCM10007392_36870 [Saccharospirillum salsuginis]